jgi:hypothetical protein
MVTEIFLLVPLWITRRARSNVTVRCAGVGRVVVVLGDVVVVAGATGSVAVVEVAATVVDVDAAVVVGAVKNGL